MTVLVDSDILIEVARGRNSEIIQRWEALAGSRNLILYSPVSAAELWAGARASEHAVLSQLFRSLTCVPINAETGQLAGDFLRSHHKSHPVELADALIAASATLQCAVLWTRNRKHYPMKGLTFLE